MRPGPGEAAIEDAVGVIRGRSRLAPECGIVLGSGLGALADALVHDAVLPYRTIPHFPIPTAAGHAGDLVLGRLDGRAVAVLCGRVHLYEGHTADRIVFPIRVLAALGAATVILTNAAGGLNPQFRGGDLMLLTDHINWTGTNPLVGPNPCFSDMSAVYDPALRAAADAAAEAERIPLRHGVYVGVLGPSYETPAEIRMLRVLGADAVGMSTVLEAIAARHAGLRICGLAAITNAAGTADAAGSAPRPGRAGVEPVTHEAVLAASAAVAPRLARLVRRIVRDLPASRPRGPATGGDRSGAR